MDNVLYIPGMLGQFSSIKKILFRLHFSSKINRYIKLPFKNRWSGSFFHNNFKDDKPICFFFFSVLVCYEDIHLVEYLRKKYPNCKCVWFLQDLFDLQRTATDRKPFNVEEKKKLFDLIVSFDHKDCEKYGFIYHPLVFSSYKGVIEDMPETDIYFLGQAKNRLSQILSVYEKLREVNLKCDFYITGVEEKDQAYSNEIVYNQRLNYSQNLQHVLHTKCLLEVMQKNGYGYTQRVVETLGLNKKLLTNNPSIKSAPFYDPKYISTFNSSDDINLDFLERIKDKEIFDYHYKEKISPKSFLEFIEQHLN